MNYFLEKTRKHFKKYSFSVHGNKTKHTIFSITNIGSSPLVININDDVKIKYVDYTLIVDKINFFKDDIDLEIDELFKKINDDALLIPIQNYDELITEENVTTIKTCNKCGLDLGPCKSLVCGWFK